MSLAVTSSRYYALDAVRGLTIALMILVNTPGSWRYIYAPLQHADWHGCTPTDLVFPFFLCVVGAAMYFSFGKTGFAWSSASGISIFRRTVIIFSLGLFLNAFPFSGSMDDLRILGVLQRIALAYMVAAIIVLSVGRWGVYLISAAILPGYWAILWWFGGGDPYSLEGNVVTRLDLFLLGGSHLWTGKGVPFDPEGLLSTLPAVVNVLIGFEITRAMTTQADKSRGVILLLALGVLAILIGLLWNLYFPINKSLWTSSFVLYTAGYFACTLAFFVWLIDIKQWWFIATPLTVYGSNPLFIYVLSILWVKIYYLIDVPGESQNLYNGFFLFLTRFLSEINASLAFAVIHVLLFWVVSVVLYRNRIFIKV